MTSDPRPRYDGRPTRRAGHRVARETAPAYPHGEVGPSLRDAVQAASTWLQRVLDLAAERRVEGGELGALLELLPALDRGHAAAVALTDTALAGSLSERSAGINYDTLLAMRTKATYTERGRLQRLAQLLRKMPHLRAAYQHGLIGTGQLLAIATEAKVLRGDALTQFDACFADTDRLGRLGPDQLVDLARIEIDRHRPDLAEARETRTVERSFLHLQPMLDGSGEGRFAYPADAFATLTAAIDAAAIAPSADAPDALDDGRGEGGSGCNPFAPAFDRPRARERAEGLLAICESFLTGTHPAGGDGTDDVDARWLRDAEGALSDALTDMLEQHTNRELASDVTGRAELAHTLAASLPRPPRHVRRARRGRPRTRTTVVVDIAQLTGNHPAARIARLLWNTHGAPPALTDAGVRRICSDTDLQFLLTDGRTTLGITAPTPSIPRRLREAVHARDQGCRFPGCRAPATWTDLHHVTAREHGGSTILTNLVALCRRHHTLVTTGRWKLDMDGDGTVTVRRGRITATSDPPLHTTLAPD